MIIIITFLTLVYFTLGMSHYARNVLDVYSDDWLPGSNFWGTTIDPITYQHGSQLFNATGGNMSLPDPHRVSVETEIMIAVISGLVVILIAIILVLIVIRIRRRGNYQSV